MALRKFKNRGLTIAARGILTDAATSIEPLNQYALLSKGELKLISKLEFDYVDGKQAEDELILQLFSIVITLIEDDDEKYLYSSDNEYS